MIFKKMFDDYLVLFDIFFSAYHIQCSEELHVNTSSKAMML